jgi:hypothetical protein
VRQPADRYHLDGNALGGRLGEIFGRDITGGVAACRDCGSTNQVGALIAYNCAPGHVVRCPGCGAILFVVVRLRDAYRLTVESLRSLQLGVR